MSEVQTANMWQSFHLIQEAKGHPLLFENIKIQNSLGVVGAGCAETFDTTFFDTDTILILSRSRFSIPIRY